MMMRMFSRGFLVFLLSFFAPACGLGSLGAAVRATSAIVDNANASVSAPPSREPTGDMPPEMTNQGPGQGNTANEPLPPSMPVPDPNMSAPVPPMSPNDIKPTTPPLAQRWLHTAANHILRENASPWMGRGLNLFDTRGCGACLQSAPNPAAVMRRADYVTQTWGVNFIRFDLESYASALGRRQWGGILEDSGYVADVKAIVEHMTSNPNTYVLLTLLVNPTFDVDHWVPTAATVPEWTAWAKVFINNPQVLFGICNEPHNLDATVTHETVWNAMSASVSAIRAVEDAVKSPHHLIAVQGTNGWSRDLTYYLTRPIQSDNIVYEVHPYANTAGVRDLAFGPAKSLPVIIGEFGFWGGLMDYADTMRLMRDGDAAGVPYISWAFHPACGIALIAPTTGDACNIGEDYTATAWGAVNRTHMQAMNFRQTGTDPTAGVMRAVQDANYCLAARGGKSESGTPLELQPCNGGAAQKFAWVGNQLQVLGACVDGSGGNQNNGALLQLWQCDPANANQQWQLDGGQLKLLGTNKCIDINGFNVSPGVQLNLWDCLAGINQLWQMFDAR